MRRNRTLLVAIPLMAVLAGLLIYQYVYLGIRTDIASMQEREEMKTKILAKYISLIAEKPVLEKKLASLKEERKAEASNLIEGQTLSLAAASLQETVKDIVTRSGGTISSERVVKPEDLEGFKVITVSMDTILPDTRALRDILYAIETRTPYLVIKDVDIRIRNYKDPREQVVKLDVSALTSSK
jgi:Type II secretion system (T2SS), protein M subtype b